MVDFLAEVKKKREFSGLLDGVVIRALEGGDLMLSDKERVKEARCHLRKYFGVFLTNRVLKPKDIMDYDSVLRSHKSSMKRDYGEFYGKLKSFLKVGEGGFSFIDLGSGVNGFSYSYLKDFFGSVRYIGVEALGQLVDNTNVFFERSGFGRDAECIHGDLFDINFVKGILKSEGNNRVVFLFQVVDALEATMKNFSKNFLLMVKNNSEYVVVSMSIKSLGGKEMVVKRNWVTLFLHNNFEVLSEFELNDEMIFCLKC